MFVNPNLSRRQWLTCAPAAVAVAASTSPVSPRPPAPPFIYCLNTITISGQKLTLVQEMEIAAKAGYGAIEPWVRELEQYVQAGGNLKELDRRLRDLGLAVPNAIGFFEWIVDDDNRRRKGLEEARRALDLARQIGCQRLAAPPVGATDKTGFDLRKAAERYRALLELGDQFGVVPQIELWGFSRTLGRLGECAFVAAESHHPRACILTDVFHLYKGGNYFPMLKLLGPDALQMIHLNDYPANPPRAAITDALRVYPGDGVAPWDQILDALHRSGFRGPMSLELFNRTYWKQDALQVAQTGLAKMKAVVQTHSSQERK
jgi:sugar phosphate isomerase/epimerase